MAAEHDRTAAEPSDTGRGDAPASTHVDPSSSVRIDEYLGTRVHIVGARQSRPNQPSTGCPFCVGGLEAPQPYDVFAFANRWPAMPDGRCEVLLYTPDHDATLWSLGAEGVRKVVDLWAERSSSLGSRPDVAYVLCFENRGADVGATISHPHGQVYAYDHVPERAARLLSAGWAPDRTADAGSADGSAAERFVAEHGDWYAYVPSASPYPVALTITARHRIADLPTLDHAGRDAFAALLADVLRRLDLLFGTPLPYMMWLHQRPFDDGEWPDSWMHAEIVSPWRMPGVSRYIAAAEVACGEYFNPLVPESVAAALRECRSL